MEQQNDGADASLQVSQFYRISCLDSDKSPDDRRKVEDALHNLSLALREDPTLPGDPEDASQPFEAAYAEDAAIQLPIKHCAFQHCSWEGDTDRALLDHLSSTH